MIPTPTGAAEMPEALRHAADIEHWARCDNGLRGTELRASAATLRRLHAQVEALSAAQADSVLEDAARYQWIRGPGEESTRYSRWLIEYWDGPNGWQPMQRERMDSAIDAARKQGANHD